MKPIRWWPAAVLLALAVLALAFVWLSEQSQRQDRMISTYAVVVLTILLLTLWMLLLSRLPWKLRLGIFGVLVLAAVALASLVEIRGVTGDWIPELAWKWSKDPGAFERADRGAAPAVALQVSPHDFPQFLGRERNATIRGVRLDRDWSARPPEEVWRKEVGPAWSGFAVVGGLALTQEQRGGQELVVAYDLATGEQVWSRGIEIRFETTIGGTGPRATPTIAGDRVYVMGARGDLSCLDLATGEVRWSRNVVEENDSALPQWGKSCSPLLVGNLVVVTAGGEGRALVAYDRQTGEPRWRGGDDGSSYSSPLLAEIAGVPQIVILNRQSVAGHDPADGRVLWQQPWPSGGQPVVAQPLPLGGDRLLVSSGYGIGARLFRLESRDGAIAAATVWESPRLKLKFSQMVEHGGAVYGLDDGVFTAIDPETGERFWKSGRYGHGQILLVEDLLLVQSERGEVILVEPSRVELREDFGRFPAVRGKAWNTMAVSGPHLLVRSEQEAACYRLPLAPA